MDERTLNTDNTLDLYHDHCYSHRIPYFSSHLPTEERSHDVPEAIEDSDLKSKDFSYDEDDLTCKEVMETEEEMDKRRLTDFIKKESEMELCKKDESKESYLDKLLKLNDAASLLTAIDDDIEKLKQKLEKHQKLDNNSDFDENAFEDVEIDSEAMMGTKIGDKTLIQKLAQATLFTLARRDESMMPA